MTDAQDVIKKVLFLIESRLIKLSELKQETRQTPVDLDRVKKCYSESVRLSSRIHAEIRVLKQMERSLNRPFVFNGNLYDEDYMSNQLRRRRI